MVALEAAAVFECEPHAVHGTKPQELVRSGAEACRDKMLTSHGRKKRMPSKAEKIQKKADKNAEKKKARDAFLQQSSPSDGYSVQYRGSVYASAESAPGALEAAEGDDDDDETL
jgi:hypothetical protein